MLRGMLVARPCARGALLWHTLAVVVGADTWQTRHWTVTKGMSWAVASLALYPTLAFHDLVKSMAARSHRPNVGRRRILRAPSASRVAP